MRIAALALALFGALAAQDTKAGIGAVGWMAGSWTGEMDGGIFEEHWMKPAGGSMVGMGRLVVKDKTVLIEFIKITETKDGLVMGVTPNGRTEVLFPCVKAGKDEAVFENPKHDHPTKITYRKEKDGTLVARIEGPGGANPTEFRLKPAGKQAEER